MTLSRLHTEPPTPKHAACCSSAMRISQKKTGCDSASVTAGATEGSEVQDEAVERLEVFCGVETGRPFVWPFVLPCPVSSSTYPKQKSLGFQNSKPFPSAGGV